MNAAAEKGLPGGSTTDPDARLLLLLPALGDDAVPDDAMERLTAALRARSRVEAPERLAARRRGVAALLDGTPPSGRWHVMAGPRCDVPGWCQWVGVSDGMSEMDVFAGGVLSRGGVTVVGRCVRRPRLSWGSTAGAALRFVESLMPGLRSWRRRSTSTMPAPRKYPDELRERAIREVRSTGRPIARVAKDLGSTRRPCAAGSARPRPTGANATTG